MPTGKGGTVKNSSQVPDKAVLDADPAFMRRVFDSLEHPFYVIDARDYTIQFANRATTNISSLRLGVDTCYAVTHRRSTPCVGDHPCPLEEVCRTHRPAKMEHIHYHRDGQPYPVEVHGEPVFDDEGNLAYMIEYCLDIRARKEMEHALAQAAQVFHHAHEGIIIADADGRIERVNEGFTAITGYTTEEAVGQRPGDLLGSGWHDADFFAGMWEEVRTTGAWQGEIWNRRRSGEIYPQWLSLNAVPRGNGEAGGYIAIFSDITEHKEQESDLLRKAYSDPLTGLPNRFTLEDR
ncbi:MAG: PAS domain-containing protein, partial [Thermoplasmata archaeon]|nr:PAS domain-containing protein [Thermoplasmata archaeon]NIW82221.1 PAS domain-containing protein [Thermoplasmata archaeon]NIW88429.1 PAS domain-containing protein [Thermoplasmata archaeon]